MRQVTVNRRKAVCEVEGELPVVDAWSKRESGKTKRCMLRFEQLLGWFDTHVAVMHPKSAGVESRTTTAVGSTVAS